MVGTIPRRKPFWEYERGHKSSSNHGPANPQTRIDSPLLQCLGRQTRTKESMVSIRLCKREVRPHQKGRIPNTILKLCNIYMRNKPFYINKVCHMIKFCISYFLFIKTSIFARIIYNIMYIHMPMLQYFCQVCVYANPSVNVRFQTSLLYITKYNYV